MTSQEAHVLHVLLAIEGVEFKPCPGGIGLSQHCWVIALLSLVTDIISLTNVLNSILNTSSSLGRGLRGKGCLSKDWGVSDVVRSVSEGLG
jgi:hypothetical protein